MIVVIFAFSACKKGSHSTSPDLNTKSTLLANIPEGAEFDDALFSDDGNKVAYAVKSNGKEAMVINDKMGIFYEHVRGPAFSPSGSECAYIARKGGKELVVVDGKEGKSYDTINHLAYSRSGRVIYSATQGDQSLMVSDGKEIEPFKGTISDTFLLSSPKKVAFVAEQKGSALHICSEKLKSCVTDRNYDSISFVNLDELQTHLAYSATLNGQSAVIMLDLDGSAPKPVETEWYDQIFALDLSENGKHLAFLASQRGETFLVVDGVKHKTDNLQSVFELVVSSTGNTIHTGFLGGKVVSFLNGKNTGNTYDSINFPSFSRNGSNFVYGAAIGPKNFIVVNGANGPAFDKVVTPQFIPNGNHVVYRTRKDGERFAVVADLQGHTVRELPHYDGVWDIQVFPDGKTVGYGAKVGRTLWWKVDNLF